MNSKIGQESKSSQLKTDAVTSGASDANKRNQNKSFFCQNRFEGRCVALKGHVYDCANPNQADLFTKTTKEIAMHVGSTFTCGADLKRAIETLEIPLPNIPTQPTPTGSATDQTLTKIWEEEIKQYVKVKYRIEEQVRTLYSLIWGQCTDALQSKLQALDNFEEMMERAQGIELLKAIKKINYNFQDHKKDVHSMHEAIRRFYLLSQGKDSLQIYYYRFLNVVETIEHVGGEIGIFPGLIKTDVEMAGYEDDTVSKQQRMEMTQAAKQRYLATAFILGSNRERYGKLIQGLQNDFLQSQDNYPKTVVGAYNLLAHWQLDNVNVFCPSISDGAAFTTMGTVVKKDKSHIECYNCGVYGHYSTECPQPKKNNKGSQDSKKEDTHE